MMKTEDDALSLFICTDDIDAAAADDDDDVSLSLSLSVDDDHDEDRVMYDDGYNKRG